MRTKLIYICSFLALALVLSACGPAIAGSESRSLSVSGSGTVYLTPDIAYISIGVHTEEPDIAQALADNNAQAQAVVAALQAMGVASEDIQTTNFSMWTTQDYDTNGLSYTKYVVDNTVYITVRDLSQLGSLLNTVVDSGANNINSISFDAADKSAALTEARQNAMQNADALATELAQTADVMLGEIQNISYTEASPYPYYGMGGGGSSAPNASVPIQPGQLQISVTVDVTYAIR